MLKWAESHKLFPKKSSDKWSWYCLQAIYLGHVHVLQWLHARGYPVNVTGASIQAASDARHVSTLNWLLRTTALPFPCETVDVLRSASNLGLVDMLQWWSDAVRPNAPHGRSLTLQYTHTAMDESPFIVVLDWWAHGDRHPHLPIKYSATAIKLSSQTGDTDLLEWWRSSSGLPLQYSHEVFEALVGDRHNDVLRWWWASGLPLKMSRHVYDRRRADVEEFFRLEPLDHDNDDTLYHERMVWWRDHIFHGKDAADRVVIVDENAVHAVQRERWLNVAAPPSLWTRISQLF
ncbi:hypothetical protein BC828DRAFT_391318 [Blastocladiella britannica]|nr:hypothetical protein BC828DRAFT_391318 [Blastocladiella britannica]